MNLTLNFNVCEATPALKREVSEVLGHALERFGSHVRHVMVSIQDVNGPRGGIDKQCRCVLHLKRRPPIVIQDCDESILSMLVRVANRAAYTLSQEIERSQTSFRARQRRGRQTNFEELQDGLDFAEQAPALG